MFGGSFATCVNHCVPPLRQERALVAGSLKWADTVLRHRSALAGWCPGPVVVQKKTGKSDALAVRHSAQS
eukprot:2465388-Pyramimonas_sp.AAC.1